MVKIQVGALLSKSQGNTLHQSINDTVDLSDEGISLLIPFTAEVTLMRLPHEIHVQITDGKTKISARCTKCLTNFEYDISIPFTEREFIIDLPDESLSPGEEVFYLDKGSNQVVLDDMIRQEILLHFPPIPVCSSGCKGLCDQCGANLNEKTCSCAPKVDHANPFRALI